MPLQLSMKDFYEMGLNAGQRLGGIQTGMETANNLIPTVLTTQSAMKIADAKNTSAQAIAGFKETQANERTAATNASAEARAAADRASRESEGAKNRKSKAKSAKASQGIQKERNTILQQQADTQQQAVNQNQAVQNANILKVIYSTKNKALLDALQKEAEDQGVVQKGVVFGIGRQNITAGQAVQKVAAAGGGAAPPAPALDATKQQIHAILMSLPPAEQEALKQNARVRKVDPATFLAELQSKYGVKHG